MGTATKVISVLLRIGECICAIIVIALLGRFFYILNLANASVDGRLVYSSVIAGISIFLSIILVVPMKYSFFAFPLDGIVFICWMVAFGLLANLTVGNTCSSFWYWSYWGYYWGRFWYVGLPGVVTAVDIDSAGCGEWRCILAFSFIGGMGWLANAVLGLFVCLGLYSSRNRSDAGAISAKPHWLKKKSKYEAEGQPGTAPTRPEETAA